MDLYKLAWLIWIVGTILIVLSWDGSVSPEVGWMGFVIALFGVGLSFIPHLQAKVRKPLQSAASENKEGPSVADQAAAEDRPRDERFLEH